MRRSGQRDHVGASDRAEQPGRRILAAAHAELPHALLQFHGEETADQCDAAGAPYLRAARMAPGFALLDFAAHHPHAAGILLDAHVEGYGGGGKAFDWSLIPVHVPRPVVLSGGLHIANVIDGITQVRPWAVDVSSGVESAPGVKDAALIAEHGAVSEPVVRAIAEAPTEADAKRLCDEAGAVVWARLASPDSGKGRGFFFRPEPGDEVIMLAPFWVSYEITVRFCGGTPVVLHSALTSTTLPLTVNFTPVTDALVAIVLGAAPRTVFASSALSASALPLLADATATTSASDLIKAITNRLATRNQPRLRSRSMIGTRFVRAAT